MASHPECPACGTKVNFTPRLDIESEAIKAKLRSEYDPAACAEIKETLSLLQQDYQDYTAEIAHLQLRIQTLSSQQRQLKQCESKLHFLLSPTPIHRLPVEVLISIFDHVCENNQLRELVVNSSSRLWPKSNIEGFAAMPALVLSSVSSLWRQLAVSYSALWSRMSLTVLNYEDPSAPSQRFLFTVKLYIERSGNSLLRLVIDTREQFSRSVSSPHPVLSFIGQHTNQWQHLTFLGSAYLSPEIFSLPPDVDGSAFPMLEELAFDDADEVSLKVFRRAPKLKSLVIEESGLGLKVKAFPWGQLTFLDVPCTIGRLEQVVDLCPKLTSLRLQLSAISSHNSILPGRAFLGLESLSLAVAYDVIQPILLVLSSLTCPSLVSLTLERISKNADETLPLQSLEHFLIQSSCFLTNLSIRGFRPTESDFLAVLRQLPSLTDITIEDPPFEMSSFKTMTRALIRSLHDSIPSTFYPSSTLILPHLCRLTLSCAGKAFDDAGLIDIVQSRYLSKAEVLTGIDQLQSVVLIFLHRTTTLFREVADMYKPLRLLEETGFDLTIKFLDI